MHDFGAMESELLYSTNKKLVLKYMLKNAKRRIAIQTKLRLVHLVLDNDNWMLSQEAYF